MIHGPHDPVLRHMMVANAKAAVNIYSACIESILKHVAGLQGFPDRASSVVSPFSRRSLPSLSHGERCSNQP
jgi:hypothetical protein